MAAAFIPSSIGSRFAPNFGARPAPMDPVAEALAGAPGQASPEPFVWSKGGARVSPERLAAMRQMAEQQMAMGIDTSPVGHWTQGAARLANSIVGVVHARQADKAAKANEAFDAGLRERLMGGDDTAIAEALLDPAAGAGTRDYAAALMKARTPKERAPTDIEQLMTARGIVPGSDQWNTTLDKYITGKIDPFMVLPTKTGAFVGPQSYVTRALGGGDPTSGAPQTMAPPAEAIAELKGDPSPDAQREFDEAFGAGSAARALGGGVSNDTGGFR